jgi:hypothetical protein
VFYGINGYKFFMNRKTPQCEKYFKKSDVIIAVRLGLVVDKVALQQVILRALQFSHVTTIPPMLHTHITVIYRWRHKNLATDVVK